MSYLIVIYDACILYSAPLRDLFMRLALAEIYQAKWTNDIHNEWIRNLLKNRPDITKNQLEKTKNLMNMHVRDALITGHRKLIKKITLPDANDRHVVAAAIHANASIIITFNISDFPTATLARYGIKAQHPDQFLKELITLTPSLILQTIKNARLDLTNPPKTVTEYLAILKQQSLTKTVQWLHAYKDLI